MPGSSGHVNSFSSFGQPRRCARKGVCVCVCPKEGRTILKLGARTGHWPPNYGRLLKAHSAGPPSGIREAASSDGVCRVQPTCCHKFLHGGDGKLENPAPFLQW